MHFTESLNRMEPNKHSYKIIRHFYITSEIRFIKLLSGNQLEEYAGREAMSQVSRPCVDMHTLFH